MKARELTEALKCAVILVDTREQPTAKFNRRVKLFPIPYERRKLNAGDYSIKTTLPDGTEFSLEDKVTIERKMSLDEIAGNLTRERERFTREFERAKEAEMKTYIIIEEGDYDKIVAHRYRSKLLPKAFMTSLAAWEARYNCNVKFCSEKVSPVVIYDILIYELREVLKNEQI